VLCDCDRVREYLGGDAERPVADSPTCWALLAKGSGGLKARLSSHMLRGKPVRWHVDQLTERGLVTGSWI